MTSSLTLANTAPTSNLRASPPPGLVIEVPPNSQATRLPAASASSLAQNAWLSPDTANGESPVKEGTPAAEAGLQPGDIITSINGTRIDASQTLDDILSNYEPGDQLTLAVLRAGETVQLSVTLGVRPADLE